MLKFIDILLLFKRKKKPICKTNSNGAKEWYLNGKELSKEEWFEQLTEEQQEKALFNLEVMV